MGVHPVARDVLRKVEDENATDLTIVTVLAAQKLTVGAIAPRICGGPGYLLRR